MLCLRILFTLLLWTSCLRPFIHPELFFYDTERSLQEQSPLQYNCLQYSYRGQWTTSITIEYCFRPTHENSTWWLKGVPAADHQKFTFAQLKDLNISIETLLSWSTSADLMEEYQMYLHHDDTRLSLREVYRCKRPWFGSRCQYAFNARNSISFSNIVNHLIGMKLKNKKEYYETYSTCYTHVQCTDHGQSICLQWHQICDGRVDCLDGGEDERSCMMLELNECQDNEYRCHNGLCIPKDFADDALAECLDRSDTHIKPDTVAESLGHVIDFVWKEYRCRPGRESFDCGDGECVQEFSSCPNGRHRRFIASIAKQGHLGRNCWLLMRCLTKIIDRVESMSCTEFLSRVNLTHHQSECDSMIEFPTTPVLLHHVHFLYVRDSLSMELRESALPPNYICFDRDLCEHLSFNFSYRNYSCRSASEMGIDPSTQYPTWTSIIDAVRPYFDGCLLFSPKLNVLSDSSSLYCCQNSSKCISKHRLIDGMIDCPYRDDEQAYHLSCTVQHSHRFRCREEEQCRSPLFPQEICSSRRILHLHNILFQEICNRIAQIEPELIHGENHTDETECEHWPCSNIYTRCDAFWNCPRGEDELNCTTSSMCPTNTLECVSILNYSIICLSGERVADGHIDCLGGADEQATCRRDLGLTSAFPGFLCSKDMQCLVPADLCDEKMDCPDGDDEMVCDENVQRCDEVTDDSSRANQLLCRIAHGVRRVFSFETLPVYPRKNHSRSLRLSQSSSWSIPVRSPTFDVYSPLTSHVWYCHHGLAVTVRLADDQNVTRCFCPPNFYGDHCEYENERVSITLRVHPVTRQGVQVFLISLIGVDQHGEEELHSHHQESYVLHNSCGKTFKFFLLYRSRPKNLSQHYYIRVDAFNRTGLIYLASWRFPISFSFLPVNLINAMIRVPAEPVVPPTSCGLKCAHGHCRKYLNTNEFYCRCDRGWMGKHCTQAVRCDDCSSDSICEGVYDNRSICICPINTFGRRCLLKYSCNSDACDNDAQCILNDLDNDLYSYGCACREGFYGTLCNLRKTILAISFGGLAKPRYVLVNIFDIESQRMALQSTFHTIVAQKLRMFQTSVTFYIDQRVQIILVQAEKKYYLALIDESSDEKNVSTHISPSQACPLFREIANASLGSMEEIRRVKYYHLMCRTHPSLMCFVDVSYFCLCTNERHANCLPIRRNFRCSEDVHCQNGAECFQDRDDCPTMTFCICSECFYGDRCQFYAKGLGLTLDDMLRHELRPWTSLHKQPVSVKISVTVATLMLLVGLLNGIFSLMTFYAHDSRQVGSGLYLLASSVTSLTTVTVLNAKFWFLLVTHIQPSVSRGILRSGCVVLEPMLKLCLFTDNWLNACVAIERAMAVYKGTQFNKEMSKRMARRMILVLPVIMGVSLLHEWLHRDLFDDQEEQRIWCVLNYSKAIRAYNTCILSAHAVGPLGANLISAIFIIIETTRRKAASQGQSTYKNILGKQLREHRHLIVSPLILTALSLPRVIISLVSSCVRAHRNPWMYLLGYFISFSPSMAIFFVFVLPSALYRRQFAASTRLLRHRISRMTLFSLRPHDDPSSAQNRR